LGRHVSHSSTVPLVLTWKGIPTADDLDIYPQVLPYVGPVGLDILVGTAGHAISTTFEHSRAKTSNELYLMRRLRHLPSSYGSADESSLSSQSNADSANESSRSSRSDIPLGSPGPRRSSTRPRSESGTFFQDENEHVYKGPRKLLGGLACLLGGLTAFPSPTPHSLDAPVSEMTPLPVGCVIPSQSHPTLNETILALQQLGNRAQLLVLPETALVLRYPEDRADAVSRIQKDVCEQYGTHVMLSVESGGNKGKAKNEVLLVGLHGVNGAYVKTSLFPNTSTDGRRRGPARLTTVIETHRFSAGEETPPTWTLDVARCVPEMVELSVPPKLLTTALTASPSPNGPRCRTSSAQSCSHRSSASILSTLLWSPSITHRLSLQSLPRLKPRSPLR
jgi:hypothetical protein